MNAFAERWVQALESGEYRQGKVGLLADDEGGYCCLGVACELLFQDGQLLKHKDAGGGFFYADRYGLRDAQVSVLPLVVRQALGLRSRTGSFGSVALTWLNDGVHGDDGSRLSFAEIAAVIRANERDIFVQEGLA